MLSEINEMFHVGSYHCPEHYVDQASFTQGCDLYATFE